MRKREKLDLSVCPKLSASKILKNNWFLARLVFSAAPLALVLFMIESFRVHVMIFFEKTWMMQRVLETVEYQRSLWDALKPILLIAAVLIVSSVLGSAVQQWIQPKAVLKAKVKLQRMIFKKAHEVDLDQFDDPEYYNDFLMTVNQTDHLIEYIMDIILVLTKTAAGLLTTGVYFASTNGFALVVVGISSVIHLFMLLYRSRLFYSKWYYRKKDERRTEYINRLFYFRDYAKEFRLNLSLKEKAISDYDKACDGIAGVLKKFNRKIVGVSVCASGIQTLLMDIVLCLGLVYQALVLRSISYSMVIIVLNAAYGLRWALSNLTFKVAGSAEECMYVEKIRDFLSREPKIVSDENLPVDSKPCSLELRNVFFGYGGHGGDILRGISLKLNPGEKIALVGYNGAGKTTLTKLILRLYDPTGGTILMNGEDIRHYNVEAYRHHIGVVFQDFNLYAADICENVVMGVPGDEDFSKINWALVHSGFGERLDSLPKGVFTPLTQEFEEDGLNLSGGEGQKIAIARAFFKDSELIILDEPSSALDPIAEYNFNCYMKQAAKDNTVIFISHRLSTTRLADRICVLENGVICEEGTHEELLAAKGRYAKMWHTQADRYVLN